MTSFNSNIEYNSSIWLYWIPELYNIIYENPSVHFVMVLFWFLIGFRYEFHGISKDNFLGTLVFKAFKAVIIFVTVNYQENKCNLHFAKNKLEFRGKFCVWHTLYAFPGNKYISLNIGRRFWSWVFFNSRCYQKSCV